MQKAIIILSIFLGYLFTISAQNVKIGDSPGAADPSAILELESSDKGFLPTRMTESERDNISNPATGLLMFQTNGTTGFYYYSGAAWTPVHTGSNTVPLTIGDNGPGGGIVFYIANPPRDLNGDGTPNNGLECAPTDQSAGAEWGCYGTTTPGAQGTIIGTGAANTAAIVTAGCSPQTSGNSIAANLCDTLTLNGYTDWFLPSKNELNVMYFNLHTNGLGGFAYNYYWSSTESANFFAWGQHFANGVQGIGNKVTTYYVRAVRAF